MAAKEVCGGRWCERGPGGICEGLGEFVVLRRRVGPWSDSTVGLVSRVPSRMRLVGCCVAATRFWDGSVPETPATAASRRVLLASWRSAGFRCICWGTTAVSGGREAFLASGPSCCAARRRRRVLWRGVVMRRAGRCDSIASRPARRFADDDRSDLVVVTCFCLVSECVSGVSECMKA